MKTKFIRKTIALCAAALAMCMVLSACSSQREDTGVANEKNMSITSAKDLEGKAVGVQLRSAADEYLVTSSLTDYPRRYEDLSNAAQDLADKKIAVIVADANYAKKLVADTEGLKIVKGSIGSIEYRFALNKSDAALVEPLNESIQAMKDAEDYDTMVKAALVEEITALKDREGKSFEKTFTLMAEPYFKPFVYEQDGAMKGLFVSAADTIAYLCGANLNTQAVAEGAEQSSVGETTDAFCVVTHEIDDESFVTTDVFYTSELVMIIRDEAKK